MKKEIEVTLPARKAVPARKVTRELFYCDICNASIDKSQDNRYGSGGSKCTLCKREICRGKCTLRDYPGGGDYSDNYCKFCYHLKFGKYQKDFDEIENESEQKENALDQKIKEESLGMKS